MHTVKLLKAIQANWNCWASVSIRLLFLKVFIYQVLFFSLLPSAANRIPIYPSMKRDLPIHMLKVKVFLLALSSGATWTWWRCLFSATSSGWCSASSSSPAPHGSTSSAWDTWWPVFTSCCLAAACWCSRSDTSCACGTGSSATHALWSPWRTSCP